MLIKMFQLSLNFFSPINNYNVDQLKLIKIAQFSQKPYLKLDFNFSSNFSSNFDDAER